MDEVIAVHARLIATFGGSLGIRDRGALESAVARPQAATTPTSFKKLQLSGRAFRRIIRLWTETSVLP